MADFTDGLTHLTANKALGLLAADGEHLAVLQRIVDGWPRRERLTLFTSIEREQVISEVARAGIEYGMCASVLHRAVAKHGEGVTVFGARVTWHVGTTVAEDARALTDQQLNNFHPERAVVRGQAWVIPAGDRADNRAGNGAGSE